MQTLFLVVPVLVLGLVFLVFGNGGFLKGLLASSSTEEVAEARRVVEEYNQGNRSEATLWAMDVFKRTGLVEVSSDGAHLSERAEEIEEERKTVSAN